MSLELDRLRRLLPDHGAELRHHLPRPQRAVGPDRPVQRRRRRLRRHRRLCLGAADHAADAADQLGGFDLPIAVGWLGGALVAAACRLPGRRADHPAAGRLSGHRHLRRRRRGAALRAQPAAADRRAVRHRLHSAAVRRSRRRAAAAFSLLNLGVLVARRRRRSISCSSGWRAAPGAACCAPSARTRRRRWRWARTPSRFRLQAFAIGGGIMGLAGAVQAHFIGFIAPDNYQPILTFQVWAMLIVGGSGNNRGAILGAVVVWGIWAASAAPCRRFVPGRRAGARRDAADRHDRRRALPHPAAAPARHSGRAADRVAPPRQPARPAIRAPTGKLPMPNVPDAGPSPDGRTVSRLVCGLWQVADLEKDGTTLDPDAAADALAAYAQRRLRHLRHGRSLRQRRADRRAPAGALDAAPDSGRSPSPNGARSRGR